MARLGPPRSRCGRLCRGLAVIGSPGSVISSSGGLRCDGGRGRRLGRCRGHHPHDRRRCRGNGFQVPACSGVQRLSRLRGQLLLLRGKPDRCGRRRGAGDDGALERARRRLAPRGGATLHACRGRCDEGHGRDGRAGNHVARHADRRPGHRLRLHEGRGRHRDDRPRHLLVGVDDVGHVRVVVVVVDDRVVDHGIAAVHVLEVAAAHGVGRAVDLARPERKPGDAADVAAGDRELEVAASHEGDQRRGVVGARPRRARDPAPVSAKIGPASVMGHREAPGRVIHPRPAPGIDPRPMSVAIRRPVGGHAIRIPDVSVGGIDAPGAVRIEVLVADDVRRHVACGGRIVVAPVALVRPAVEFVEARRVDGLHVPQSGSREAVLSPRIDRVGCAFAIGLAAAPADHDGRGVAVGIDVDAIGAGAAHGEGEVRRVDFEGLVGPQAPHAHVQGALRQLQLGDPVVEVEDGDGSAGAHAQRGPPDLDLGARVGIRPQAVARGQRPVDVGLHPLVLAGGRELDCAGQVTQAGHARRRVREGRAAQGQDGDAEQD